MRKGICTNTNCYNYKHKVVIYIGDGDDFVCSSCGSPLHDYKGLENPLKKIIDTFKELSSNSKTLKYISISGGILLLLSLIIWGVSIQFFKSDSPSPPPTTVDTTNTNSNPTINIASWTLDSVKLDSTLTNDEEEIIRNSKLFELENLIKQKQNGSIADQDIIDRLKRLFNSNEHSKISIMNTDRAIVETIEADKYFLSLSKTAKIRFYSCETVLGNDSILYLKTIQLIETED